MTGKIDWKCLDRCVCAYDSDMSDIFLSMMWERTGFGVLFFIVRAMARRYAVARSYCRCMGSSRLLMRSRLRRREMLEVMESRCCW